MTKRKQDFMAKTIFIGNEPMLFDTIIDLAIKNGKINPFYITKININYDMPTEQIPFFQIKVSIEKIVYLHYHTGIIETEIMTYNEIFLCKQRAIYKEFSITYLEHLRRKGIRKIKLQDIGGD